MEPLDYVVLAGYFVLMIGIGVYSALRVKAQEDFFMGGRSFGKLLQTFAAFGAGTGSSDPVNTARTTYTSGMSGMWSVMYWLFVTPFYWITGVWYRRMRHLTLGDWFVERYESKALGTAYCLFGIGFFIVYGSMLFSAIGKVAAPLIGTGTFLWGGEQYGIEYLLVPIIGVVVLIYGIAGGLRAAYFTDLIQGIAIILLSIILVPYGLTALVAKFGDPSTQGMGEGFRIMHEQLPEAFFTVVGTGQTSEFPLHRIIAIVLINLVGIVVQPHFIATGGGSARNETSARVGLVTGNFLKRFCTIGWVLTALIAVALYADSPELVEDPDKTWGVASRELLGPGLTGLMLACLLAALMSSVDAYMIVGSGLMVRNFYAAWINPHATEQQYVRMARLTGVIVVGGAVLLSMYTMDVFLQLQLTWVFAVLFAAPFWIGMFWRGATTLAAWCTVGWCALMFFLVPIYAPKLAPELRTNPDFTVTNQILRITTVRPAAPSDVERRTAAIALWEQAEGRFEQVAEEYETALVGVLEAEQEQATPAVERIEALAEAASRLAAARRAFERIGERPAPLEVGDPIEETTETGGSAVYWSGGVKPVDDQGNVLEGVKPRPVGEPEQIDEQTTEVVLAWPEDVRLKGFGNFRPDFLLYDWMGMDFQSKSNAMLDTLTLPPKIVTPFLVMILISLVTRRNSPQALDRYYAKMKTPVDPDPARDHDKLEAAYANPQALESRKLFPGTSLEFQKPTAVDVIGFAVSVAVCFAIIGLAVVVARIGS